MSSKLDYQIAKEYLNKLPREQKMEIINGTLGQVTVSKKEKQQIRKFCSDYIKSKIQKGKI
ncbi:hypothetical protein ACTJIV_15615 [Chryseobacterium sp. 22532]|uniref:hypothetical protein n=1 Tax=Chryseobacterium sp. 22532 TaxID=3453938 RepID=UPI003F831EAD